MPAEAVADEVGDSHRDDRRTAAPEPASGEAPTAARSGARKSEPGLVEAASFELDLSRLRSAIAALDSKLRKPDGDPPQQAESTLGDRLSGILGKRSA